ncbi:MAG: response regulator [Magnetococcus sp. YQC-5]
MKKDNEKHKILIVDDVPTNIMTLATILKEHYEVLIATSGHDALELVAMNHIDLVVLDIVMPDMNGYEVCRRLKNNSNSNSISIIFMTASQDDRAMTKSIVSGGVYYLQKPVDVSVLQPLIKHLLSKR